MEAVVPEKYSDHSVPVVNPVAKAPKVAGLIGGEAVPVSEGTPRTLLGVCPHRNTKASDAAMPGSVCGA